MTQLIFRLLLLFSFSGIAMAGPEAPTGLMTDLLEHTDTVWQDGFPTNVSLENIGTAVERLQYAAIVNKSPTFSWIVNDTRNEVRQTAFELEVAKSKERLTSNPAAVPDLWKINVETDRSSSVEYKGKTLPPGIVVYWRVRTWNNGQVSPWSEIKAFKMSDKPVGFGVSRYPTVNEIDTPTATKKLDERSTFYDFGRASFGQIVLQIESNGIGQMAVVQLGERIKDGRVDDKPAGSTRYAKYELKLLPGLHHYRIKTRIDQRNSTGNAVLVPDYIGEVMPFRYASVELSHPGQSQIIEVRRLSSSYPFDAQAASFHCDNEILNSVWNLCRYSIKATSFLGVYIDGDRERIPYEGDALLNQLSHYCTDREYSMARHTQEYLLYHPTWPTEWILQSVQMAWYDYLYTDDARYVAKYYDELKAKSLLSLAEANGLISTRKGKLTKPVVDSVHFTGKKIQDIVDWPWRGLAGNDNADSGETDGFVFEDYNVVVNSYHYFAVNSLLRFAKLLGRDEDVKLLTERVRLMGDSFQKTFFDAKQGVYRDGDKTDHVSLHGNMFPLAFGLVEPERTGSVTSFIKSRQMRCSVYGAQFLLDAVYEGGDGDYGFERMTAKDLRGWYNMIKAGSTITMEAWDDRYKPNQDWNHAWGAAPANIIPRRLVGVEPLAPAFARMRIRPQVGLLKEVDAVVPTIRGPVAVRVRRGETVYRLQTTIPANTVAEVWLPVLDKSQSILVESATGKRDVKHVVEHGVVKFPEIGSGAWNITITK